ncbi:MAG: hypothetical protein PSN04_05490, partial [Methyloprofundus sp.]|nr:hypothetical protein [Methyloprofundus sp.]
LVIWGVIMGDWQYIEDHMGGHDEDGLPNFMSAPGFADNSYEIKNPDFFETFQEAIAWAKSNPGKSITRAADGNGYIKK